MKYFWTLLILVMFIIVQFFFSISETKKIYPIYDSSETNLPINFRIVNQAQAKQPVNLQGLEKLRASGSGQFSEENFVAMMNRLPVSPEKVIILDLRQESHGFVNGKPISWTDEIYNYANLNKTKSEVELDEIKHLKLAAEAKEMVINPFKNPSILIPQETKTEKVLVENHGANYLRFPVTDHNKPSDEIVDQFIELIKNLPPDQWLHIHCKGGKGRTTIFLTLYDMMHNACHMSSEEMIARQYLIGGTNLTFTQKNNSEQIRAAKERLEFVQNFYRYCQEISDFEVSWSKWSKKLDESMS